jgi:two-component system response regulator
MAENEKEAPQAPQAPQVLLIDDDEDDYVLMADAIREADLSFTLKWIHSGEEALRFLKDGDACGMRPSLILIDLNMPGMNGLEIIKAIKTDDSARDIPVVALTTSASDDDVRLCYRSGVNSYIKKPSEFSRLLEIVRIISVYWLETVQLPRKDSYNA